MYQTKLLLYKKDEVEFKIKKVNYNNRISGKRIT
ncbi:Protein of unknown function [Bacillus cereus]|nr:Protein of unknown function [Bacillus cereus]